MSSDKVAAFRIGRLFARVVLSRDQSALGHTMFVHPEIFCIVIQSDVTSLTEKESFHVKSAHFYEANAGRFGSPGSLKFSSPLAACWGLTTASGSA